MVRSSAALAVIAFATAIAGCAAPEGEYVVLRSRRLPAVHVFDMRTLVVQGLCGKPQAGARPSPGSPDRSCDPSAARALGRDLASALSAGGDFLTVAAPTVTAKTGGFMRAEADIIEGARKAGLADGMLLARLVSCRLDYRTERLSYPLERGKVSHVDIHDAVGETRLRIRLVNLRNGITVLERTLAGSVAVEAAQKAELPGPAELYAEMRSQVVAEATRMLASSPEPRRAMLFPRPGIEKDPAIRLARRGQWPEAMKHWKATQDESGPAAAVENNLGVGFEAMGLLDEARRHYRRAVELDQSERYYHRQLETVAKLISLFEKRAEVQALKRR